MGKLISAVRNALAFMFGYTVRVYWDEKRSEHFAFTYEGVLDWMRCYPSDAQCYVSLMGTRVLTARGQQE